MRLKSFLFSSVILFSNSYAAGTQACEYTKDGLASWAAMVQRQLINNDKNNAQSLGKIATDIIYGDEVNLSKDIGVVDVNTPLKLAGGDMSLLDLAVASCQHKIVKFLIARGAPADGDTNSTPLVTAAAKGDVEMMKYLIGRGARINKTDMNGHSPLEEAVRQRKLDATTLLLSYGDSPNKKLANGGTLLDLVGNSTEPVDRAVADALRKSGGVSGLTHSNRLGN